MPLEPEQKQARLARLHATMSRSWDEYLSTSPAVRAIKAGAFDALMYRIYLTETYHYAFHNAPHIEPGVRCEGHVHGLLAGRRPGIMSHVFHEVVAHVFERLEVDAMVFEPSVDNTAINNVLSRLGLHPVTTHDKPARGICIAMRVHRYEVTRTQIDRISRFSRSHEGLSNHGVQRVL